MKGKTWLRHHVVSVGKHLAGNRLFVWTPLVNEYFNINILIDFL